jgi:bacterial/archaeal transporter family protein
MTAEVSASSSQTWLVWALLSAVFAALTAIFAKIGLEGVDSDYATLVRTAVIVVVLGLFVAISGKWQSPGTLTSRSGLFLVLSALATGASWVCCAKFGQSVLYELARVATERRMNLNVWECTHLGADRFAAIAVAFPQGYMYGRMRAENVPAIMEYLEKGYPYPPCYRGQLGLNSIEQTAQAFGHSYWFEQKIENVEVTVISAKQTSPEVSEAFVTISDKYTKAVHARFALELVKQEFHTSMDCDGVNANAIRRVSRWVVSESRLLQ